MEDNYTKTPEIIQNGGNTNPNNTLGTVGLVSGITGLIFDFCCSPLGVLLGIVALVCGILAQGRNQKFAAAGIVLGAIALALGLVLSIFYMPFVLAFFLGAMEASTY